MTLVLKPFLREMVTKSLKEAASFPVQLPKNPRPMQIKRFTSFRAEHETGKHIVGEVCEKEDYISAVFTADCCNNFARANDGERLSSKTGLLIYAPKWRLNIASKLKNGSYSFKAVVFIDEVELIGEMGVIADDPRDLNSRQLVQEILADTSRRDIYLKRHPAADDEPGSQPERSTPFRTQAESPLSSQRRPLSADEAGAWAEMEELLWPEYQIDARQQGMLASDNAWFHPANIERYQRKESGTEEERLSGTPAVVAMDGPHPPLTSPAGSPPAITQGEAFQTQAVLTMDGSQTNGGAMDGNGSVRVNGKARVDEGRIVEATPNEETSGTHAYEWEPTPSPEQPIQEELMEVDQPMEKEESTSNEPTREEKEPYETQVHPLSVISPTQTNGPPPLNSSDEESDDDLASQAPLEDEGGNEENEEPHSQAIFFEQDDQQESRESTEENAPPAASMAVSTAQILSQHVAQAELMEKMKVSETIEEEPLQEDEIVQETSAETVRVAEEDNVQEGEEMQEVEQTDVLPTQRPTGIRVSVSMVERDVRLEPRNEGPSQTREFVVPSTILADQSTLQDDSTTTQHPNSTPSIPSNPNPTGHGQTQSQENPPSRQATIPSTQSPVIQEAEQSLLAPASPISARAMSPSKGTPISTSTPIQVQETPPRVQSPGRVEEMDPASSAIPISATAPSSLKRRAAEVEEPARRKHKRDRHVGPIVPRFSRQEREMNWDLEAILLEDRQRWITENNVEPMEKEKRQEVHRQDDVVVAEEVVIEAVIVEEEQIQGVEETKRDEDEDGQAMEDIQVTEQLKIVKVEPEAPSPAEKDKDVITAEEEEIAIEDPKEAVRQPPANVPQPEPLPQATPSDTTKWGRFAAHWRRFAPFTQHNTNI